MSDENRAEVAQEDEKYYEADKLFTGRPAAVKLAEVGDSVTGTVAEVFARQKTKFGTDEPEFFDDGTPKLEPVIVLRTAEGLETLYVSSWRMQKAIGGACAEAGVRGPRPGGTLMVRLAGFGEPWQPGAQKPKEYEASYDPPPSGPAVGGGQAQPELAAAPRARVLSAECAGGDHQVCYDQRCGCECGHPSPVTVPAAGVSEQPPF